MLGPRSNFGTNTISPAQQPPGTVPSFAAGGAIDEETGGVNPMMDTMGSRMQVDINAALGAVKGVLDYGRQLHGLGGGGDKQAASMPMKPFSETPKPQPMMPPSSLPYGPGEKPFGKRSEGEQEPQEEGGAIDVAGVIPSAPYSETAKPQPMPGPLPPTSNPFGKRAEAEPESDQGGAIQTDDEEAA